LRNIALTFACLIALAMTGSRYGLITTSIGIVMIFLLPSSVGIKRRWAQIGLLLVLLPLFGWTVTAVATKNKATLDRLESLRNPLQTDSFRKRLDVLWQDAGADIARSPLLGLGPAKERFTDVFTDSEYLDVLKKFGVIGFAIYLLYYLFPLLLLYRGLRFSRRIAPFFEEAKPATFLAMRLSFVMGITALLMNIGESTFYNQLLQAFLWMWLGLGVSSAESIASFAKDYAPNSTPLNYRVLAGTLNRPVSAQTFRQHV
jgi:O-antigen ligase